MPYNQRHQEEGRDGHAQDSNRNVVDTENALVTLEMLEVYWRNEIEPYDVTDRFFRLLKKIDRRHLP